ncbi:MAG: NADH-quinone oxidoreductase subunit N, partial [bacterium]|nr:NADH-quinone oxidoreductase subunit N [bacterium]
FFFYLRLVVVMYFRGDECAETTLVVARSIRWVLVVVAGASVALGIFPGPLLDLLNGVGV